MHAAARCGCSITWRLGEGLEKPRIESALCLLRYWRTYERDGWDVLEIAAFAPIPLPDSIKARAAGYAEAHFQADRIFDYWTNYRSVTMRHGGRAPGNLVPVR